MDRLTQLQHDEDSANGLWVQNKRGESWPAYGDKQLNSEKSKRNFEQARNASQGSINEVWNAYKNNNIPDPEEFQALQKVHDRFS